MADWFSSLPGFWQQKVPDGHVRASHILFLGATDDVEKQVDEVLDRINSGALTFQSAALMFSLSLIHI